MAVTPKTRGNASTHSYVMICRWAGKCESDGHNTDRISGRWPMEKKWMFVALGYAILLSGLEFAVDAGIAAMIVAD